MRIAILLTILITLPTMSQNIDDPSTTMWYTRPATSWQHEALPIGNGRIGAMIFGGVGYERIALNEESVWSGSRIDWNRDNASKNLPRIRELLLAGKNAEAEALVNQTFTCVRGGSRGGASGPWGCYQELGNLNIAWASTVKSIPLNTWKYSMIKTPGIKDIRQQRREVARIVSNAVKADFDDSAWADYVITDGKNSKGWRRFSNGDRAVLRCAVDLTEAQCTQLGMLRLDSGIRNGQVYVNGKEVGSLPGWQSGGHARLQRAVAQHLQPGKNVIAISCGWYRRTGQMPLQVSLDPKEDVEDYRRAFRL